MGEEDNHTTLIIVVLGISLFFILALVVGIYFVTKSGRSSVQQHRDSNTESHTRAHSTITAQEQAVIDHANEQLRNNGLPNFQLSSDELNPYSQSTVSIVNGSGREDVDVCSNNEGFQPIYDGTNLACPDGLLQFSHEIPGQNDWYCCMLPDDPMNISTDENGHKSSKFASMVASNLGRLQSAPRAFKIGLGVTIVGITLSSKFRSLVSKIATSPYKFIKFVHQVSFAKEAAAKQAKEASGFKKAAKIVGYPFRMLKKKIVDLQLALLRRVGAKIGEDGFVKFIEERGVRQAERVAGQQVERQAEKLIFKKLRNNIAKGTEGYFTNKFTNAVAQKAARDAEEKLADFETKEVLTQTLRRLEREALEEGLDELGRKAAQEVMVHAAEELAERVVLEAAVELAAETAVVAAEGSICTSGVVAMGAACPETLGLGCIGALALGVTCLAAMVATVGGDVGMLFDIMYMVEMQCDAEGWNQYQSNSEKIITFRNQIEGKKITNNSVFDVTTPFTFDLSNLSYLINLNVDEEHPGTPKAITSQELHDLRNIYDIYLLAHNHYENSFESPFKEGEPSQHNMLQINDAIDTDVDLNFDVIQRMLRGIHDNPTERDDSIWDFMKTHLNASNKTEKGTDNLKYIRYVRQMSKGRGDLKPIIGITLNNDGIAIFNKEAKALNDDFNKDDIVNVSGVSSETVGNYLNNSGENPTTTSGTPNTLQSLIPLLINSKYYRDIFDKQNPLDENGIVKLEQRELETKFTLESPSKYLIEKYCTIGMDKDKLPGKKYKEDHPGSCEEFDETWVHPIDDGVTYNDDTGLCNYTDDFCRTMGYGDKIEKSMQGTGLISYFDCEESESQENLSAVFGEYLNKKYPT
jgi:hypothetical protein